MILQFNDSCHLDTNAAHSHSVRTYQIGDCPCQCAALEAHVMIPLLGLTPYVHTQLATRAHRQQVCTPLSFKSGHLLKFDHSTLRTNRIAERLLAT